MFNLSCIVSLLLFSISLASKPNLQFEEPKLKSLSPLLFIPFQSLISSILSKQQGKSLTSTQSQSTNEESLNDWDFQKKKASKHDQRQSAYAIRNNLAQTMSTILGYTQGPPLDERIKSHGYPVERHVLQTEDNYELTMYQIPSQRNGGSVKSKRKKSRRIPVLVQHGVFQNSACWLYLRNKSIALRLADSGYDVWLGNTRGDVTTTGHVTLDPQKDSAFWDYSLDEMIKYDIPAMIDYILSLTRRSRLYYIGFSFGIMEIFGTLSSRPEYNQKVAALAPATYFGHSLKHFNELFKFVPPTIWRPSQLALNSKVFLELLPMYDCLRNKFIQSSRICNFIMDVINVGQINPITKSRSVDTKLVEFLCNGISLKIIYHMFQIVEKDQFYQFNYGTKDNLKKYGQPQPSIYDMRNVTVPIFELYAFNDSIISRLDARRTIKNMPNFVNPKRAQVKNKRWRHGDFWMGSDAPKMTYAPLIKFLNSV